MIKLFKITTLILVFIGLTACVSTNDIVVKNEKSAKVDLTGYKTYSILDSSGMDKKYQKGDSKKNILLVKNINTLITEELTKKGKTTVTSNPDFYVAYAIGTDMKTVKEKLNNACSQPVKSIPEAGIVMMLVDAKTGAMLWTSSAEGDIKDLPPEQKQKRIRFAIQKMLNGI